MTGRDGTLHAWVDESMHVAPGVLAAPVYLLAATVADPGTCEPVRDSLRSVLLPRARRLHWRDESLGRQHRIAAVIASHDLVHTVVVGTPVDPRRQERARRQCMERLLLELANMQVTRVWLENRTASLNRRDVALVAAVRSKKLVPKSLGVGFELPSVEPMLWVPDAVAGAVGAARKSVDLESRRILEPCLVEIDLGLR